MAARGIFAAERMRYATQAPAADHCPLIRATTTAVDLARIAGVMRAEWKAGFANTLRTAGKVGKPTFLTRTEVRQILFAQIVTALEFTDDQRLSRPLGSLDRPRVPNGPKACPRADRCGVSRFLYKLCAKWWKR